MKSNLKRSGVHKRIDNLRARAIADSWNNGIKSPMYSFASTGKVWHGQHKAALLREIKKLINWNLDNITMIPDGVNNPTNDIVELVKLFRYIKMEKVTNAK